MRTAVRLTITGVVQGVGFRPFVHRLANQHHVAGWVRNQAGQVDIHAEGATADLRAFSEALPRRVPPTATIETMTTAFEHASGLSGFRIVESADLSEATPVVSPDIATCDACIAEMLNSENPRYRYAFISCVDCGPRYAVIHALPYDRERTSLRKFPLCGACTNDYGSPGNRRFHAESIACPECGPHLTFEKVGDGTPLCRNGVVDSDDMCVDASANVILAGGVVAVRGIGGFHLAVDATNANAVARLRTRKRRDAKPLACMFANVVDIQRWTTPTAPQLQWLSSRQRPIVLVALRHDVLEPIAPGVCPGLEEIGAMLPSTALHHLLLAKVGRPLVMTSGNLNNEPLAASNDEARARLRNVADAFLMHDREIVARLDDSVIRLAGARPIFIRRARGYAPLPLSLPVASPVPLLAVGAHLKNALTLVRGDSAYVSPHIGDIDSLESLTHWTSVRLRYQQLFRIVPRAFVADAHDGYPTTQLAMALATEFDAPFIRVQHHHAHIAAVAAEHHVTAPVIGLAFDGTGAGADGTVWGMEFLRSSLASCERVGHLKPAPLPGGNAAVRAPWRSLAGFMSVNPSAFEKLVVGRDGITHTEQRVVQQQIAGRINTPMASSAGRLFDAVASLLGVCHHAQFEGQPAMLLEALAGTTRGTKLPFPVAHSSSGMLELDFTPLLVALTERKMAGVSTQQLAADFHESVASSACALTGQLAETYNTRTVVLSGGCFQNARLLTRTRELLTGSKREVLVATKLPANDGGISYGQAAVAAAQLAENLILPATAPVVARRTPMFHQAQES